MTEECAIERYCPPRNAPAIESSRRGRRRIVSLIFVVYGLLIFEGALRKWIFPQFQKELFFIRDPFVFAIYFLCIKQRVRIRHALLFVTAVVMAWLTGLLVLLEIASGMLTSGTHLQLAIYGWREYFLNIPLAFVIGECVSREDLKRLVKYTLLVSIPIAILSIFQSSAPASAVINAGTAIDPSNTFSPMGVELDFNRTSGTFTSNEGQALFIGSIVAMLLWVWILPRRRRPVKGAVLLVATAAVITNLAVSGQRTAFVMSIIIASAALMGAALMKSGTDSLRNLRMPIVLVTVGVLAAPLVFPDHLHALSIRAANAAEGDARYSYGIVDRALGDFTRFTDLVFDSPVLGYGLGFAGNASSRVGLALPFYEDDWSRNIVDLGVVLGVIFIIFRVTLVLWLIAGAVASTRRWNDALPSLLVGFIGVILLNGQITGQGTVNGYAWLFAGFCMATIRTGEEEAKL
jgi:hypothetical protein